MYNCSDYLITTNQKTALLQTCEIIYFQNLERKNMDLFLVASGAKKVIPQIVSRSWKKCPIHQVGTKLSLHSQYTGDGTYTELYYSQKKAPQLTTLTTGPKYSINLKQKRHLSTSITPQLSQIDLSKVLVFRFSMLKTFSFTVLCSLVGTLKPSRIESICRI